MARTRSRIRRWVVIALGLFAIPLTYVAQAFHTFPDVDTAAFYHNQVEWIFNRAITTGCGGGLYCPTNNVTRGQMAVFMRNLGVALTPAFVTNTAGTGAIDLEQSPQAVLCQAGQPTPSFPQRVRVDSWVSFLSTAGGFGFFARNVHSIDGGATWVSDDAAAVSRSTVSAASEWAFAANSAVYDLTPGTSYIFGVQVGRISGTADPTDGRCEVVAEIVNRNPGTSPLGPQPEVIDGQIP